MDATGERMRAAKAVKVTLGVSILVMAGVLALTLSRAPPRVVRAVGRAELILASTTKAGETCQPDEVLPAGVSALRITVAGYYGATLRATVYQGSRIVTEGSRGGDWTGTSVTVPVKPLSYTATHVKLCVHVGPNSEPIFFAGSTALAQEAALTGEGAPLAGRLGVEDLAAGQGSWWSRALSVARRMGLGHALSGTWVVLLIAALVAAVGVLAVTLTLRELG